MIEGITGIQEAQRANLRLMRAIKPQNGLGRGAYKATFSLHRYAVAVTHVDTGALRASHRIGQLGPAKYRIYIDPASKNPRTGELPSIYGITEHRRGGEHAFYKIAMRRYAYKSAEQGALVIIREIQQ